MDFGLSEVIALPELQERVLGAPCLCYIQVPLNRILVMAGIYPELFLLIDSCCKYWIYTLPSQCFDVMIFRQGIEAEIEKQMTVLDTSQYCGN